ncbi:trypco2 family protein [Streptomyces sp. SudanB182_2057]|uniref:trypco2 family protein n=1 Tax=Streptomyces sp. SudanB182_2057 TaxID=3035281 RepID=UPI003F543914
MEIGLADALRALRAELAEATLEAAGDTVRLHVEQVDLNLEVSVQRATEGGGGVRFWVLSADAKAARETTITHTVSLRLTAETAGGGRVLTGDGRVGLGDR